MTIVLAFIIGIACGVTVSFMFEIIADAWSE